MSIRSILWYLAEFAVVLCVLHLGGSIPWRASAVLTFFLVAFVTRKSTNNSEVFTPFTFTLHPHVRQMLIDIGYADEAFFNEIGAIENADPWGAGHMDRFGITGYALQRSDGTWPIVHWPELKCYTEGIGFDRQLEFMKKPEDRYSFDTPGCFCRAFKNGGLAFGLSVSHKWWKENDKRLKATGIVLGIDEKFHFGTVDLTLAILPREAEWWFSDHPVFTNMSDYKKRDKVLTEALQKNGWHREENDHDESWMQSPWVFQHPYATVYMNNLHEIWH